MCFNFVLSVMRFNEYFSISCSLVHFKIISLILPFSKPAVKLICQLTSHLCNQFLFDKNHKVPLQQNMLITQSKCIQLKTLQVNFKIN